MKKDYNKDFMHDRYAVILCGGSGERLWPLSRKAKPKQLLSFMGDKTLLEQTIERIAPLLSVEKIGLITTHEYQDLIKQTVGESVGILWIEPVARNTAPAILLAAYDLALKDPEALIAFLPADHFIPDAAAFNQALDQAFVIAAQEKVIVTLGIKPTHPATGYGYIHGEGGNGLWSKVIAFHEKPHAERAAQYVTGGFSYWNIGIFVGTAGLFCEQAKKCAPEIFEGIKNYYEQKSSYELLPSISFDYAIAEKSDQMVVIPCDFEWSDIGNLEVFLELTRLYATNISQVMNFEGEGNSAYAGNKLVAYIGVSDVCVIETDDVTLVVKKSEAEKVKAMVGLLKQEKKHTIL